MSVALVCPDCKQTCRSTQELRPGTRIRCPECGGVFRCFIHGNGAVELRPADSLRSDEDPSLPDAPRALPPRVGEPKAPPRTIFTSRRKNRPQGGYMPFEKSRSYIGLLWFFGLLGFGSMAGYWYVTQIKTLHKATEKAGTAKGNVWGSRDEMLRNEFQARQKKALEALKARQKAEAPGPAVQPLPGPASGGGAPAGTTP